MAATIPDQAPQTLTIGDVLTGHCDGVFGQDSYAPRQIEAVGSDWIVVRDLEDGEAMFHTGDLAVLLPYVT